MQTLPYAKFLIILVLPGISACQTKPQSKNQNKPQIQMSQHQNPLLCNPEDGICALPDSAETFSTAEPSAEKPLKIIYFTDPICSSCWGIEPQLRKLKLEYGHSAEIEYRMGGLLPDWSYNSGGISKPSDVAAHWDEVSAYYDMPIDGDVWLEDPLNSSYPPSIAFKAAQLQDEDKAVLFLREIREMVFLRKLNIAKWEHLKSAAIKTGLDPERFEADYKGRARSLFEEDLALARQYGVRGFPSLYVIGKNGEQEKVYGSKPYAVFETALKKLYPAAAGNAYATEAKALFARFPSMTAREFSELSGLPRAEAEQQLNTLLSQGFLSVLRTKNGALWTMNKSGK